MGRTQIWAIGALFGMSLSVGVTTLAQEPTKKKDEEKKELTPQELENRKGAKELTYRFKAGEEFHATAEIVRKETKVIVDRRATDEKVATITTISKVNKVDPDGTGHLDVRVTRVQFKRSGRIFVKYDSEASPTPESAQNAEGWPLLTQAHFTCKVNPRGQVSDIRPDSETAAYWNAQHRDYRPMFSDEALTRLLPFVGLPDMKVRRGTRWEVTRSRDDEFGKRDIALTLYYAGTEIIRGRTLEAVKVNGDAKLTEKKPKYEIVDQLIDGRLMFDFANGNLKYWNFYEDYLFNPPGTELTKEKKDEKGKKKKKGGRGGRGDGSSSAGMDMGGGDDQGGGYPGIGGGTGQSSGGFSGGGSGYGSSGGGRGKGAGGGGDKAKKKKEELEELKKDKSVALEVEAQVILNYRGQPLVTHD